MDHPAAPKPALGADKPHLMSHQLPQLNIPPSETDAEEAELIKLHAQWEEHMTDLSPQRRYKHVAVLLLFWDKVEASYLDTSEEIRDLRSVLENQYRFTVLEQSLNPTAEKKKKSPQLLLQKCLADFVYKEDEEDSLLIVYYAGHGNPGSDGELVLTGGNRNHPGDKVVDGVAWTQTERLIHVAEKADILLIFDCCFAGKLCGTLDRRSPLNSRIFEFLGATVSNGLARLPGKESFTRALIWALQKLANEEEGFTTSRLYNTILKSPDFPKHVQTPVLSERRGHCLKRLVLAPLPARSDERKVEQPMTLALGRDQRSFAADDSPSQQEKDPYLYSLSLQLCFPKLLNKKELEEMCSGLKQLVRSGELQAKQIIWRGMHRKGSSPYEMPHSAHVAAHSLLSLMDRKRRRSSREVKKPDKPPVPRQNPSPTSERDGNHEQVLEVTSDEVTDNEIPTQRKRRKRIDHIPK